MSQQSQAKVLRIGIIQDGKIVQERLIKAGDPVTVGDSPKCTFVLPKGHLPVSSFTLFKPGPRGYSLQVTEQMKGKISAGGAVVSLQKLGEDPAIETKDGVSSLLLSDSDRGKVQVDSATVLFQFVAPPPVKAVKPIQQMDFRPRMFEEDDPIFIGFLGFWSALGLVLALWVWNTEIPEKTTEEKLAVLNTVLRKVEVEKPPTTEAPTPDPSSQPEPEPEPEPTEEEPTEAQKAQKAAKTEVDRAKAQDARKNELLASNKLLKKLIGTTGVSNNGTAANNWGAGEMAGALKDATSTTGDAGEASRMVAGAGGGPADIGDVGEIGGGKSGKVGLTVVAKPEVKTGAGLIASTGDEGTIKSVVNSKAGQLTYCYETRLKEIPDLAGKIEVGWTVAAGAVVGTPFIKENTTGDAALADCVMKKIRRWEFPKDADGTMSWPFVFSKKE